MTVTADLSTAKNYDISSYEANLNNEIKPYIFFNHLEDAAYANAEMLHFGYTDLYPKGYGWFVVKYHVKFDRLPSAFEKIKVKTWAVANKGIQARRDFQVFDENGVNIANATSLWVLIDFNNKRIVPFQKAMDYPEVPDTHAMESSFEKIPSVETADREITLTATFEDIDLNNHVNNSIYLNWAIKSLDYDFLINHSIKEIEINYKHEITLGNEISCKASLCENNTTLHTFVDKTTNEETTNIRIHWAKR